MIDDNDRIFHPLRLASGSHQPGSGKGCAMNVISYENGDKKISDYPECSDRMLARIVQGVNDSLADADGYLSAENSLIALDLGHQTVGTAYHGLNEQDLKVVYVRCAIYAARKVIHLAKTPKALAAIDAAEKWADEPNEVNRKAAADADAYAAADAAADAYAYAAAYAAADAAADAYAYADAAAAAAAAAYAYAAADAAAAAAGKSKEQFKIELAGEIITLFKELTGTGSKPVIPEVVNSAIDRMMQTA
jgi:hypothetical protein